VELGALRGVDGRRAERETNMLKRALPQPMKLHASSNKNASAGAEGAAPTAAPAAVGAAAAAGGACSGTARGAASAAPRPLVDASPGPRALLGGGGGIAPDGPASAGSVCAGPRAAARSAARASLSVTW